MLCRLLLAISISTVFINTSYCQETAKVSKEIVDRLIEGLSSKNEHTRRNSASNLSMYGPAAKSAVVPLIKALNNNKDVELRMYSALALGSIGPDAHKAVPSLRRALAYSNEFGTPHLRTEAAKALGKIGPKYAGVAVNDLLNMLESDLYGSRAASFALAQLKEKAIPGLLQTLKHKDPNVRYYACRSLSYMRDLSRDALEKSLQSKNTLVRRGAARSLAMVYVSPQTKAVPALSKCLTDPDEKVRHWAAVALTFCVTDSDLALKTITDKMKKEDEASSELAILLSRVVQHQNVLKKLLNTAEVNPSRVVRSQVIRSIGLARPNHKEVISAIKKGLNDPEIGSVAAVALFRIDSKDLKVRRLVDEFFSRNESDAIYPGYKEDLELAKRKMRFVGPNYPSHSPEAIKASARLFRYIPFKGKTKQEVAAILKGIKPTSTQQKGEIHSLFYRFATGIGGMQYELNFKNNKVTSVTPFGIN